MDAAAVQIDQWSDDASFIFCRLIHMEGDGFLSDILLNGVANEVDGDLAGFDDLDIPMTQETQHGDVEEVQASRSTKGSKRTKNFFWKEDEVICSGWLNVSKDPIHGANQSRASFWKRVHAFFEKNKETSAVRTQSSIMHRWLTIQLQVNKYCSCYEAIERRNQSGQTIQNKVCDIYSTIFLFWFILKYMYIDKFLVQISEASKMYTELDKEKKSFTLIHCYDILKGEDKWKAKRIELAELEKQAKKKQKPTKASRPRDEEATINEGVTDVAAEQTEPIKR